MVEDGEDMHFRDCPRSPCSVGGAVEPIVYSNDGNSYLSAT